VEVHHTPEGDPDGAVERLGRGVVRGGWEGTNTYIRWGKNLGNLGTFTVGVINPGVALTVAETLGRTNECGSGSREMTPKKILGALSSFQKKIGCGATLEIGGEMNKKNLRGHEFERATGRPPRRYSRTSKSASGPLTLWSVVLSTVGPAVPGPRGRKKGTVRNGGIEQHGPN